MKKFLDRLTQVERILGAALIALMAILIVADVFLREVFATGLVWAPKTSVVLMIWSGLVGGALVSQKAGHLRPEIGDQLFKNHPILFIRLQNTLTLIFNLILAWVAYLYVAQTKEFGDHHIVIKLPMWILQMVIPYGFFSMGLRNIYFLIHPKAQLEMKNEKYS